VTEALIDWGVDYVEGGWPNETNPIDVEFFKLAKSLGRESHSRVTAFGMTRRPGVDPSHDQNLAQLLRAETDTVTIFGKSWSLQVDKVLKTTLEENRKMIFDSVQLLKSRGRRVIYDAEHFFDGYAADPDYALSTLVAAEEAGSRMLVLCDTRGGSHPLQVYEAMRDIVQKVHVPVGIHCHNDRGMATANSLFAIMAGASHVQGTMNGLGERVGNADLIEVIANLHLMGAKTRLDPGKLTSISVFIDEMAGLREDPYKPFVGRNAFAHKGGVHGDAVLKTEVAYEFYDPSAFGNERAITVSSQAGRSSLLATTRRLGFDLPRDDQRLASLLQEIKHLESRGCNLENAQATLELVVRRTLERESEHFRLVNWKADVKHEKGRSIAQCKLTILIEGKKVRAEAKGNGPVNAFDQAFQLALRRHFGSKFTSKLTGFRVKEINSESGTAARVAVYIDISDGSQTWTTVASSTNIIEASVRALIDGYAYGFVRKRTVDRIKAAQSSRD
jgi:2-isopropylmalate synthase